MVAKQQKIFTFSFPFNILGRDLRLIVASNLTGSFGDGLYAYLLPVYMTETLKADPVQVGILYAVLNLFTASTMLLTGVVGDRYDRKKIMIVGWGVWVPAPICFALAKNWFQMLPGMALWGSWVGGPTMTAYIATAADKERVTSTFTAIFAAWSLGYVFSPAVGGFLAATVGMRCVFYLSSILYASAGLILLFISSQRPISQARKRRLEESQSLFQLLKTRKLLALSIAFASLMFTTMLFRPFISKFLADVHRYGDFEVGVSGSVLFLGSAILSLSLGKLGDRYGRSYANASSLAISSLSLALLMMFRDFRILMIAVFLAGSSYTLWSLMNAIIGPQAPESIRTRWISVPQSVSMFSSFIAPYVGGVLYDTSPYHPFIVAIALMLLLACLISTRMLEDKPNTPESITDQSPT